MLQIQKNNKQEANKITVDSPELRDVQHAQLCEKTLTPTQQDDLLRFLATAEMDDIYAHEDRIAPILDDHVLGEITDFDVQVPFLDIDVDHELTFLKPYRQSEASVLDNPGMTIWEFPMYDDEGYYQEQPRWDLADTEPLAFTAEEVIARRNDFDLTHIEGTAEMDVLLIELGLGM
ncbi:MAG: hypothetical protein OXC95_08880 [Dehalococcoidia bacterium]|nr:hypothetical protein [Dehalococcoidia bacterium]